MPPAPKIGDRFGKIRVVEVGVIMKSKHPAQPDCHIRIGREIIIELDGIEQHPKPRARYRKLLQRRIQILLHQFACCIGNHHLFGQADAKAGDALAHVLRGGVAFLDLRCHVAVPHNRSCHQLMVARQVHQIFAVAFLRRHLPAVDIQHIADGLKGIKGDADGQRNLRNRQRKTGQKIQILHKKPLYLKTPSIPKSNSSEAASASFIRRLCPLRRKYSIHLAQM